jgi:catechol 2,3-dioxygenase
LPIVEYGPPPARRRCRRAKEVQMANDSSSGVTPTLEFEDQRVIAPTLHHVNLATRQLQAMIDWYGLVVGMRVVHRAEVGAWLSNDAANHRLALLDREQFRDDPEKIHRTGLRHTAFEYATIDELLASYVRLKDEGILPRFCIDHGMTISFYYADPDGNRVELQVDNYGDWAKSKDFMLHDPRFAADPLGPDIDPDALVEARRQDASLEELHERGYNGGFPVEDPLDPLMR